MHCVQNIREIELHTSSLVAACCVQGAYWTLEKRTYDLHKMPNEWDKVVLAFTEMFPDTFTRKSVKASLRFHSEALHLVFGC